MIILGALMGFLLLPTSTIIPRPIGYAASAPLVAAKDTVSQALPPRISKRLASASVESVVDAPRYAVTLTAYNAVPEQTDENPFETASGMFSNPEIVAARSANLVAELPFGTVIAFDGSSISSGETCGFGVVASRIGYRVIADSMNPRFDDRIDILFATDANYTNAVGSVNAATVLGICQNVTIRVVGRINMKHPPQTQAELTEMVNGNTVALAK